MKDKIIEILKKYYPNFANIESVATDIMKIAEFEELCKPDYAEAHMNDAVWEQNLRDELIKFERYAGCEYGTIKNTEEFVDEYLKSREK